MSNEMVERVAAEAFKFMTFGGNSAAFSSQPQQIVDHYKGLARAILTAMREPTEEMYVASDCGDHEDDRSICKEVYQAMLDAALKE